jgi:hypothetical protein
MLRFFLKMFWWSPTQFLVDLVKTNTFFSAFFLLKQISLRLSEFKINWRDCFSFVHWCARVENLERVHGVAKNQGTRFLLIFLKKISWLVLLIFPFSDWRNVNFDLNCCLNVLQQYFSLELYVFVELFRMQNLKLNERLNFCFAVSGFLL